MRGEGARGGVLVRQEQGILDRDPDEIEVDLDPPESFAGKPAPETRSDFIDRYQHLLGRYEGMLEAHSYGKLSDQIRICKEISNILGLLYKMQVEEAPDEEESEDRDLRQLVREDPARALRVIEQRVRSLKQLYTLVKSQAKNGQPV